MPLTVGRPGAWLASLLVLVAAASRADEPLGPVTLAASLNGSRLYVAALDGERLLEVDPAAGHVCRSTGLPGRPANVALTPDGRAILVACGEAGGVLTVVDSASLQVQKTIAIGHSPSAIAVAPDGGRAYVCSRFDGDVAVVDLTSGTVVARWAAVREPIAAALTPDGGMLVVANHLPDDSANVFFTAAAVSLFDTACGEPVHVRLPNGSTGARGVAVSPDGRWAYVTHVLANYELSASQVDGGWMNTNAVSIVDLLERRFVVAVVLDELLHGAGNPWGIACSDDGRWLAAAHSGTDELSLIDRPALHARIAAGAATPVTGGIPNHPGILGGIRRRLALGVKGPRGIALAGGRAFAAGYFSDRLASAPLDDPSAPVGEIGLGPTPAMSPERRGEILFHDATICYQQWQSCASCHPDARADGLNWDLLNDGVGNPKNTKSMVFSHATPPSMALGVRDTAETAVRKGLSHILFADVPESDAEAIDAYLRGLRPQPGPQRSDPESEAAAKRGQALFESPRVGCARCHPAPYYTDLQSHDVGTKTWLDTDARFDTPTLRELWRTAPYLHDGRYRTIEAVFAEGRHGLPPSHFERLSPRDLADLAAFLRSL